MELESWVKILKTTDQRKNDNLIEKCANSKTCQRRGEMEIHEILALPFLSHGEANEIHNGMQLHTHTARIMTTNCPTMSVSDSHAKQNSHFLLHGLFKWKEHVDKILELLKEFYININLYSF